MSNFIEDKSKKTIMERLLNGDKIRRHEVSHLPEYIDLLKANKIKFLNSAENEFTETTHSSDTPPSHDENDMVVLV